METNRFNTTYTPAWEDRVMSVLTPREKKAAAAAALLMWMSAAYSIIRIWKGIRSLRK